jgi:hypothetical protein
VCISTIEVGHYTNILIHNQLLYDQVLKRSSLHHQIQVSQMESTTQATQRKFTQLRTWVHGNDEALQRLLGQIQQSHPDKDSIWCIDRLWTEQRAWH